MTKMVTAQEANLVALLAGHLAAGQQHEAAEVANSLLRISTVEMRMRRLSAMERVGIPASALRPELRWKLNFESA